MGDMADYFIEQMQFPFDGSGMRIPLMRGPSLSDQTAEQEFSTYKEKTMPKSYSIDVNSEKKVYRVKPPLARGSFMSAILVPEPYKAGDPDEWSCQLRWPIDAPEVKEWANSMGAMFKQILIDKFGEKKGLEIMKSPNIKIPLRNGNTEEKEEYHSHLFMNVRNKFRQPIILGPTGKALSEDFINDSVIYSGAWYRSRIVFTYYDVKSKGIGAYVEILMKIKDDTRLDNVIDVGEAEGEFSTFATDDVDEFSPPPTKEGEEKEEGFDFL